MKRFTMSAGAENDLDEIIDYLRTLPKDPAKRVGISIQTALQHLASYPLQGRPQSNLSLLAGNEIRSRLCTPYRIFYSLAGRYPEVIGIIHTSRDLPTIMEKRLP